MQGKINGTGRDPASEVFTLFSNKSRWIQKYEPFTGEGYICSSLEGGCKTPPQIKDKVLLPQILSPHLNNDLIIVEGNVGTFSLVPSGMPVLGIFETGTGMSVSGITMPEGYAANCTSETTEDMLSSSYASGLANLELYNSTNFTKTYE